MKIIIAPDSFKDSLSAAGTAQAIAEGLAQVWPDAQLVECPMADGGKERWTQCLPLVTASCVGNWCKGHWVSPLRRGGAGWPTATPR